MEINTVPEWVDWDQIKRGQEVFFRYGMPIVNVLRFQSLLGGIGRIVRRRLLETLQHVPQVSLSLDGMKPGGAGHKSSARVRLLPSLVQSGILNLVKEKPEYYNVDEYGILINYLDCLATINTFSSIVVWIGLERLVP
ncbi:hypothetical protein P175DRAFT_0248081 [Aspergillus ochraceoroseus IBT 24754]|uniref:Uncharacterized protein n=1 Tax=Aspergillus ochraceoroseus IBT 24754 TaxID=1392256 RepID=A0A2T5LY28_9EURO|nr:uncharacterized protein P175DRAFT_0248081 [Aspergillus ochraceoroseus IBT 24754]PTU21153.1 hypothetical protein P175DRAFT_0248081 [Aspergillus ochraceoroseus IBT 24754]